MISLASDASWTAIVLAGERPGGNPLTAHFDVALKALLPLAGEPMINHVVRALLAADGIARVVVTAQSPEALRASGTAWLWDEPRVVMRPSGDGIANSVAAMAGSDVAPWPVLITTADHALLTPRLVSAFVAAAAGSDVAVGVVERAVIHASYPESRRTWLRFRGGAYSGANLFALLGPRARAAVESWSAVEADRKKAFRLLWRLGPGLALLAATRMVTLDRALALAGRRMGLSAVAVQLDTAEAAMDVDTVHDASTAERILLKRRELARADVPR